MPSWLGRIGVLLERDVLEAFLSGLGQSVAIEAAAA